MESDSIVIQQEHTVIYVKMETDILNLQWHIANHVKI